MIYSFIVNSRLFDHDSIILRVKIGVILLNCVGNTFLMHPLTELLEKINAHDYN